MAEILELEPITLVRILDRLQAAGLIERRHHATDRRLRLLYLTDEAHPILGQMRAIGAETRSEALAGVSDADRERLIETLLVMRANLTAPATRIEEAVAHG